tara:strand:+ start:2778 stop:2954 length:177 start_codon:yes stop_codon:yes gene_type:complete
VPGLTVKSLILVVRLSIVATGLVRHRQKPIDGRKLIEAKDVEGRATTYMEAIAFALGR